MIITMVEIQGKKNRRWIGELRYDLEVDGKYERSEGILKFDLIWWRLA